MSKKGFKKFVLGIATGTFVGMMFAPKKGSELRSDLKEKLDELLSKAKDIDTSEVKKEIEEKIENLKVEIEDLDKEKVLKVAKKKAKEIEKSAEELVNYAIEKGTPVLEKAASSVKEKAILVTKNVLEKLEKEE